MGTAGGTRLAESEPCLIYSVGSRGDFSFEEAVRKDVSKHCEVHTFDPSPQYKSDAPAFVKHPSVTLYTPVDCQTLFNDTI